MDGSLQADISQMECIITSAAKSTEIDVLQLHLPGNGDSSSQDNASRKCLTSSTRRDDVDYNPQLPVDWTSE